MSSTDFNIAIGANISGFQAGMVGIRNSVSSTVNNINAQFNQFNTELSKVKATGVEMASYVATAFNGWREIVGAASKIFAEPLRQFSRYEDAATRLAPLVGGIDAAKTLTKELRDEAANGYLSLEQLASVAGRLATVFKSTSEVKQWTSAFHNLAAGTGMDVNELVGNFVRSKASGRFEAGFMDMFAQKGVNIFEQLVSQTGQSEAALRQLATAGKLAFSEIESAILALSTGTGKFAGQAAALSNTLSGSFGTLKEEFNAVLADFGEKFAERFTGALQTASGFLKENRDDAAAVAAELAKVGLAVGAALVSTKALAGAFKLASGNAANLKNFLKGNAGNAILAAGFYGIEKISDRYDAEADELEGLNAKLQKLSSSMLAIEEAKSFEDLEQRIRNAENALRAYESAKSDQVGWENINTEEFAADRRALSSASMRARERLEAEAWDAELRKAAQRTAEELEAEKKKREEIAAMRAEAQKREREIYESKKALFEKSKEHVDMLRAEIEGNAQKVAQLREQAALAKKIAEFKKAGYDDGTAFRNASGLLSLEKQKAIADFIRSEKGVSASESLKDKMIAKGISPELAAEYAALKAKASQGDAGGSAWSSGFIGTAQSHLGGGGGFSVGENMATSLARESVQVQTRMEKLLEKIAGKHIPNGNAVFS